MSVSALLRERIRGAYSRKARAPLPPRQRTLLRLESLEDRIVPAAIDNQAYVATLYQGLLDRAPDTYAQYWVNELNAGASTIQVASGIIASTEYRGREVERLYESILGHPADLAGINYWVGQMESGQSLGQVKAGILGSDEFFQKAGGTNSGFLNALYQDVLGRPVDSQGTGLLPSSGGSTAAQRTSVALQVVRSNEADQREVQYDFQEILGHAPDQAGLNYWTGLLNSGAYDEAVLAGIFASAEYFQQIQSVTANSSDANTAATQFASQSNRFQVTDLPSSQSSSGSSSGPSTMALIDSPAFGAITLPAGFNAATPGTGIGTFGSRGFAQAGTGSNYGAFSAAGDQGAGQGVSTGYGQTAPGTTTSSGEQSTTAPGNAGGTGPGSNGTGTSNSGGSTGTGSLGNHANGNPG